MWLSINGHFEICRQVRPLDWIGICPIHSATAHRTKLDFQSGSCGLDHRCYRHSLSNLRSRSTCSVGGSYRGSVPSPGSCAWILRSFLHFYYHRCLTYLGSLFCRAKLNCVAAWIFPPNPSSSSWHFSQVVYHIRTQLMTEIKLVNVMFPLVVVRIIMSIPCTFTMVPSPLW